MTSTLHSLVWQPSNSEALEHSTAATMTEDSLAAFGRAVPHGVSANRPSQVVFGCGSCGFRANADPSAVINILVRAGLPSVPVSARGTGAAARGGAIPWGTPAIREPDMPTA